MKLHLRRVGIDEELGLSPANCGGLIEALTPQSPLTDPPEPFPRELRGPH